MTVTPPRSEHLDVLLDVDGVLYPLPELFTPYAAERLGRELSSTRRTGSSTRSGASATTTSSSCSARACASASCGGQARRTPTSSRRSTDPRRRAPHPRGDGPRRPRHRGRGARRHRALARTPRHRRRHDHARPGQDDRDRPLGLDPAACVAVDDGPHYIDAFEQVGVYGIVLDRWGSYRGEHLIGQRPRRCRRHRSRDGRPSRDAARGRARPSASPKASPSVRRCSPPSSWPCGPWRRGWVPLFDAAYFTVRSRDVATAHNPLVGAWSMGSREVGAWINNLGPLQLDVLAPFTKLDPYWGIAAGVAATNIAAIVGVWLASRRIVGPIGVVGAMAATVLLELNEGSLMLIEARQQLALVLPMWCTLWLAAAAWTGRAWALPWLALGRQLRAADALHLRLPDRLGGRRGDRRTPVAASPEPARRRRRIDRRRRRHRGVLGAAAVGSGRRHGQPRRGARPERRLGAVGRSVARPADPRRVGVRPAVPQPGLDGRPAPRRAAGLVAGRRASALRLGSAARRLPRRDAAPPPRPSGDGGDRHRRAASARSSPRSRSHRPSSSGSSRRTTTGPGRSPCS